VVSPASLQAAGEELQDVVGSAAVGAVIVLADGTYTGSGGSVLEISQNITIRALNTGQAVLDGEYIRRVIHIWSSPTVVLEGLVVTRGNGPVSLPGPPRRLVLRDITPVAHLRVARLSRCALGWWPSLLRCLLVSAGGACCARLRTLLSCRHAACTLMPPVATHRRELASTSIVATWTS